MRTRTIRDVALAGKRVLMRVDFNVPLTDDGAVSDDSRIRAALPTIQYIRDEGGSLVLMSHLGRPSGKVDPSLSLKPAADRLAELLGGAVEFASDCVGAEAESMAEKMQPGDVLVLENLRFHPEEEGKAHPADDATEEEVRVAKADMKERQKQFAAELASLGQVYANDAFGTAHRAHASTAVITECFDDCVAGFLIEKEIKYLGSAVADPERPFVAVVGGAKIAGKIDVLVNLIGKVDSIIIGGAMAYTFYVARGLPVGASLVEQDKVDLARDIMEKADAAGVRLILPVDHVVADEFSAEANVKTVEEGGIEDGWMALDVGPKTIELFKEEIAKARTVVWNGPMGCFEMDPFASGTMGLMQAVADADCVSIVGGGDSASAVMKSGLVAMFSHVSTGGGASLEFLEGKKLPGIAALDETD